MKGRGTRVPQAQELSAIGQTLPAYPAACIGRISSPVRTVQEVVVIGCQVILRLSVWISREGKLVLRWMRL